MYWPAHQWQNCDWIECWWHYVWCGGHFLLPRWYDAVLWWGLWQCNCCQILCGLFRKFLPGLTTRHLSPRIRGIVHEACVRSAMFHGSEPWGPNRNTKRFIYENAFENVVCEMAAILSRGIFINRPYFTRGFFQVATICCIDVHCDIYKKKLTSKTKITVALDSVSVFLSKIFVLLFLMRNICDFRGVSCIGGKMSSLWLGLGASQ